MKYSYYPGCTLYSKAKDFDDSGRTCASILGIELKELPNWTCCGTTFPLVTDNLITLVSPVRNLAEAKKQKQDLVTLCAFCYNVLKRTNSRVIQDPESRQKINDFLREDIEEPYKGEINVFHLLEILRDKIGFENVKAKVKRPLDGLKIASYYGCMLLRPKDEMNLDDIESPSILDNLMKVIGAEPVDYPFKTECCGSYLGVSSMDTAIDCSGKIINSAIKNGAEAICVSCPLCFFNLDTRQEEIRKKIRDIEPIPVYYFTELLGLALGIEEEHCGLKDHTVDPRRIFAKVTK